MNSLIGLTLYGLCDGWFQEEFDKNNDKIIIAAGCRWIVVKYCDWNNFDFVEFADEETMALMIKQWSDPLNSDKE